MEHIGMRNLHKILVVKLEGNKALGANRRNKVSLREMGS
jgi:hypothetical protein